MAGALPLLGVLRHPHVLRVGDADISERPVARRCRPSVHDVHPSAGGLRRHHPAAGRLAVAAGSACGFTMTLSLAASKSLLGGYTVGFAIWAPMNAAAFYIAFLRVGFRHVKQIDAVRSDIDVRVRVHGQA